MAGNLRAGAAAVDITPKKALHLFGYPHVPRTSTGVHDPLFASSMYLASGEDGILFISCDVIFVPKAIVTSARQRIQEQTGLSGDNILITATHTHSGPDTVRYLSNESDSTVPEPDAEYMAQLEDGIVSAGVSAVQQEQHAVLGKGLADGRGVGTNRRNPEGLRDAAVPVVLVRSEEDGSPIGLMLICAMHPTVLHEDSTLISGDFPGLARLHLQGTVLGASCPVLYCMGASGNQSPRHVTRANTFEEAKRLGEVLGESVAAVVDVMEYGSVLNIQTTRTLVDLPIREFPDAETAASNLDQVEARYKALQAAGAPDTDVRTAECDLFGAQETLTLAHAARSEKLQAYVDTCMPAEIQVFQLDDWTLVGWPGEVFVEFALTLREHKPDAYMISIANGELQGYLVTEEAVQEGGYEASNALFQSPESGMILLERTVALLQGLGER